MRKLLYSISWTQPYQWTHPYATDKLRPYIRAKQEELEQSIESILEEGNFKEALDIIRRIQNASKSN